MRIINCIHPKFIVNPYTNESLFVPCGKCPSCLNAKSLIWQNRLENEVRHFKYLYFATLTYDDDHMHVLLPAKNVHGKFYVSNHTNIVIPFQDVCDNSYVYDNKRILNIEYLSSRPFFPHLYKKDVSSFIKRLRSMIHYYFKCFKVSENEKIQFFACGEYGETTFRPHYHILLWFNSQFISNNVISYISKCWKYGACDVKAANSRVSQYLTKYCNSFGSLPQIYLSEQIRPFTLCSKLQVIGLNTFDESQIQRIFRNSLVEVPVWNNSRKRPEYVRLWRSLENKLFPKFKGFNNCNHSTRVRLLSINSVDGFSGESFTSFFRNIKTYICSSSKNFPFDEISKDKKGKIANLTFYIRLLYEYGFLESDINGEYSSLRNLYYLSRTCTKRAYLLGLSMDEFVSCIELYYEKVNYYNLRQQFEYEDYCLKNHLISKKDLIYLDFRFVKRIVESENVFGLSRSTRITLCELGFTDSQLDSYFSIVDDVRQYVKEHPYTSLSEYLNFKSLHVRIYHSNVKNKLKKDTLDYYKNDNLYSFTKL